MRTIYVALLLVCSIKNKKIRGKLLNILLVWMVGSFVWAQPKESFVFNLPDVSDKAGYSPPIVFRENTLRLLSFYDDIQMMVSDFRVDIRNFSDEEFKNTITREPLLIHIDSEVTGTRGTWEMFPKQRQEDMGWLRSEIGFWYRFNDSFQASASPELPKEFLALCHEKGLHLELFEVEGASAFVLLPRKPARGNPWVWYAPAVDRQPNSENFWYFERLLGKGISVAGYHIGEVRGAPASTTQFSRFYDTMLQKGYASKPVLLGQSRGGLMMLAWAMRNPGKVKAFAGIFPVCNLTNWPLKNSKEQVLNDYGLSETELLQNLSLYNPVDNLHGLARNRIPMFVVHGDEDKLVPYEDNSGLLMRNYKDLGGLIVVELISGEGHKVTPSFFESKALLRFVIKQSRSL